MQFNLLDEPWIPVLREDGTFGRVGIREALLQAGRIRTIAAANPMDRFAVLRFLLALLYWCRGNPDGSFTPVGDGFPPAWFAKLDDHRDCFNLLGDGRRFYQTKAANRLRPTTDLLQEIPTGHNFWHFRHATDGQDGLCPACCAQGLLRLPLYSVSGRPDMKAGINGAPPIYAIAFGTTLLDTLLRNWRPTGELGEPSWIASCNTDRSVSLLAGFTLVSRLVWLHDAETTGACINCGDTSVIRTCEFQSAGSQENERWVDPHVLYREGSPRKSLKAPDLTAAGKFRMDRPWPELLALLAKSEWLRGNTVLVVGFATDQAKNIDVWERTLNLPAEITPAAIEQLDQWQRNGNLLSRALLPTAERTIKRKHVEIAPHLSALRPHIEHQVSADASALLSGEAAAWERAADTYAPLLDALAKSLAPGATVAARQRQAEIREQRPILRQPNGVKGGNA